MWVLILLLLAGCNTTMPYDINEVEGTAKPIRVICTENMENCSQMEYNMVCVSNERYQELLILKNGTL